MDRVKLKVLGLSYSMSQAGAYALILADEEDLHRIPIVIGMPEAQSIAIQLEKLQTQRPLTHDLVRSLADALGASLREVFIYRLQSGIFYSELLFETDSKLIQLDSRTSDAIALALRYDCPIYTTPVILEKAGIRVGNDGREETPDASDATVSEALDEQQDYSVQELNRMLEEAVQNEEYEKASQIRDMLKKRTQPSA